MALVMSMMNVRIGRYIMLSAFISLLCAAVVFFSFGRVSKTRLFPPNDAEQVTFNLDGIRKNPLAFTVRGWGIVRGKDQKARINTIVLHSDSGTYRLSVSVENRQDVHNAFISDGKKYTMAGFAAGVFRWSLPKGRYKIYLRHESPEGVQDIDTGKTVRL